MSADEFILSNDVNLLPTRGLESLYMLNFQCKNCFPFGMF